ncbi:MAG: hypothetical protein ABSD21_02540 [Rhizomicrobium sp.]
MLAGEQLAPAIDVLQQNPNNFEHLVAQLAQIAQTTERLLLPLECADQPSRFLRCLAG